MKIERADIFIDIIDNYGDMWWVLEFLCMSRLPFFWRIVTDQPSKIEAFMSQSGMTLPPYEIYDKKNYDFLTASHLIILGLHASLDFSRIPVWRCMIRVNYLTYDTWYEKIHNTEHILSTPERPIIELIYSPLPRMGGIWKYEATDSSRTSWLETMHLPRELSDKIWIPLFCYKETLRNFDRENIPKNSIIFLIGNTLPWEENNENIITLPWMKRDNLWDLIDLGDISVLRGEISSGYGLTSKNPYLWDMYKQLGWWNQDESEWFLSFIWANSQYRRIHAQINGWKKWDVYDILDIYHKQSFPPPHKIRNFRETLQKTIDSFGFSL